jgi:hypothetical protein
MISAPVSNAPLISKSRTQTPTPLNTEQDLVRTPGYHCTIGADERTRETFPKSKPRLISILGSQLRPNVAMGRPGSLHDHNQPQIELSIT